MILHHVPHCARFLEISTATAHADGFADSDLHMLNRLAAPELLEDGIRKPEHHDVLHRLLAQIMIDAKDLPLARVSQQMIIQHAGTLQIVPERFLHHHPLPKGIALLPTSQQSSRVQLIDHLPKKTRRDREIKYQIISQPLIAVFG